ncbi:Riboflavin transporter RibZ [Methanosarcinaceae archaeon Ag5]|uniref:Riboflavin transporter RibZ n=1 Tax=Methanolapillus africanus TaxID=3028297 RepID=A0AAE4MKE1_9EURY|nr:Riboflavin transporter RibZ [Methanosarcinaceae archaeon Ag5]
MYKPQPNPVTSSENNNPTYTSREKKIVLAGASIAAFITPFAGAMVNLSLPHIGETFQVTAHALGWMSTAYLLASVLFLIPVARLADLYGRKKVFLIGTVIIVVTSFLAPFSPTYGILILLRFLDGMGMACIFSTSLAILSSVYPPKERGAAFGINVGFVYVGSSMGPVIGGIMTDNLGWQSLFFLLIPLALIGGLLIWRGVKSDYAESHGEPFDWIGTILYGATVFFLIYGLTNLPELWAFGVLFIGICALPLFVLYEKRQSYPVLKVKLFIQNKLFRRSNMAAFLNYAASYSIIFFLSLYLQSVDQLSAQNAGLVLLAQPVIQAVLSPAIGKLSDKIDTKYLSTLGMLFITAGLLLLTTLQGNTPISHIIGIEIVLGLGFAFFAAPNTSAVMGSVGKRDYSSASSMLSATRQAGMVVSMAIAMCSISFFVGNTDMIGPDMIPNFLTAMRVTFMVCAGLCAIGAVLSYMRGPSNREVVA